MYIVNSASVKVNSLVSGKGVTVRYLLHAAVGAKRIQLRLFTVEPGGYTPLESHKHEHEIYILRGNLLLRGKEGENNVGPGNAIFIASMEPHQFSNPFEEPAEFLCTKETEMSPETS